MLERLALSKDALKTNGAPSFKSSQARKRMCSSLSMTHGPATSASGAPPPISSADVMRTGAFQEGGRRKTIRRPASLVRPAQAVSQRGADEGAEQGVRFERLGLELGMKLAAQIPGVVGQFADLHVHSVRRFSGEPQPMLRQNPFVLAIELVAMAVALADFACAISRAREAVFGQQTRIGAQAHGSAQLVHSFQLAQLINDP